MQPFNGNNKFIGNPLINSPFIQSWEGEGLNPPPPGADIRITDAGDIRITDANDRRITD